MPELPEVETVVVELARVLPGRTISRASLSARDLVRRGSRPVGTLAGARIVGVVRRGKAIRIRTERNGDPLELVVHLGMTGQLSWRDIAASAGSASRPTRARREPHLHARLHFDDGSELVYIDPRRFGYFFVGAPDAVTATLPIGPDPFDMRAPALAKALAGRHAPIKSLLLNQRIMSGMGNIYVDEALFVAGIHPLTAGARAAPHAATILSSARRILTRAIRSGGTTIRDYRRSDGSSGTFQGRLAVYGRDGEPCLRCGTPVERIVVSQRGTHFCPRCQPRDVTASTRTRSAGRSRRAALRRGDCKPSRT
jgi:formamidopyrimidine-DNA glycosylase